MLISDPVCHANALTEGSEILPVSSPTLGSETAVTPTSVSIEFNNNISSGSGATSVPVPLTNNNIGSGVTSSPVPSYNTNTGSGVTSTPVPNNNNITLVEGSEISSVSPPLSCLETESPMDSLSQSSSVAAVDTNSEWETPPPPFHSSSFPLVEGGDESSFGSVLSTPEFLPSPASSTGRFEALIGGAPVAFASQSEPEPLDRIETINRAILTDPQCLQLLLELPVPFFESNNGSQDHINQH